MKILWITSDCFFDTDRPVVPYIRENYDIDIYWVILQSPNGPRIPYCRDYNILTLHYKKRDPRIFGEIYCFLNKLQKSEYNLIYSDAIGIMYYTALLYKKFNLPIIHAAHNVISYWGWNIQLKMEVRFAFILCKYFQVFSKHTALWFSRHYPKKSFFYAPMVVKDYGDVRTRHYNICESKLNLLFFGNVRENKRLDLLIDAIIHLPKGIRNQLHLNVCGSCTIDRKVFYERTEGCDAISFYFNRIPEEDIPELFSAHHYLVLPYSKINQSGPHMIAYNYNLPVIASNIDGLAERIEDGVTGFLFDVDDEQSLKDVITKVVKLDKRKYEEMKERLKQYVEENFSLKAVSERYVEYFEKIQHKCSK